MSRTSGAPEPLAGLAAERLDHRFKGLPPDADGRTVAELTAERRNLFTGGFPTPVLTLSAERLAHNLALLESYTTRHHLAFAPHGKTTMAPALFHRQLAHGAWGITLAMPHQVRVARKFGISRIFLANELVDAAALRWLAAEQDADPAFRHICYVDSVRGVELMDAALQEAGAVRPLEVVVELAAGPEGRTGVRTEASVVADAVSKTRTLQLVGVAGYEAQVPDATADAVRDWTRQLVALAVDFDREGRFSGPEIVVSAGGSEWFDAVTDVLAEMPELSAPVLKLLRSGAYVTHDHLHYRDRTPFNRVPEEGSLEPAFRLWAQVVSRPTAHQAFLNAGKRDVAYDLGLPVVEVIRRGSDERTADGISVTALSDQHAWLETGPGVDLEVGDWVGLGLSHPCTTFEKWPLIPVVEADGTVAEYVRTFF
ncbi:amino acid deaminase [Streptomyces acidiscabies]|uniref:Amino acid deaminase n=1 Tax=Streptomyces acidiscabies TaxID=42234 RepID=A0AAP6BJZ1_9ACTN|nr:amino acid deaminase [Streptomyces acidiscabies]MBZ3914703.1 amino acid deaminase [Streptomyces acidiscabies]MDX2966144.1 amino acid deaminase [Streptomyces acidiscabies]MDX3020617.1 amino acid deaminase [Streptomyces acidiscabies]MDX3795824.1 amino acid deaminase [Streptomyces acidiscabies]GAV41804.1 D-threonine aldolase [Streptomyces acidiscabies]